MGPAKGWPRALLHASGAWQNIEVTAALYRSRPLHKQINHEILGFRSACGVRSGICNPLPLPGYRLCRRCWPNSDETDRIRLLIKLGQVKTCC